MRDIAHLEEGKGAQKPISDILGVDVEELPHVGREQNWDARRRTEAEDHAVRASPNMRGAGKGTYGSVVRNGEAAAESCGLSLRDSAEKRSEGPSKSVGEGSERAFERHETNREDFSAALRLDLLWWSACLARFRVTAEESHTFRVTGRKRGR